MTTVDHRAEAETNLTVAAGEAPGTAEERYYLAAAQVHATLALVEQQRLTNLNMVLERQLQIFYQSEDDGAYVNENGTPVTREDIWNEAAKTATEIREGVALA